MKKLLAGLVVLLAVGCSQPTLPEEPKEPKPTPEIIEDSLVSFMAVGDNLIHGAIPYDSMMKYGYYTFDEIYEPVKEFVQSKDIAYINQETMLGGKELGITNYPQFNSPQEIGAAVANTGFDWVASSSNHSMDVYEQGILNTLDFWDQYPGVTTTGLNRSQESVTQDKFIIRNGVTFGVLGYTYGTNGIPLPEGKDYLVNLYSEERIREDVKRIKQKCEAVIVSMHWGTEYSYVPNEEQVAYAQLLADLGVLVVIGEHPHVIQPMDWVTGEAGNEMLVIYSLGNFLSAQDSAENMLGGCASFDVRKDNNTNQLSVENVQFYPTVTHYENNFTNFKTFLLKDYSDEQASTHGLNSLGYSINRQYFIELTEQVMNDKFEIVY